MSCDCYCYVALPHGAVDWSAVSDCGISWSYPLAFLHTAFLFELSPLNEPCMLHNFHTLWDMLIGLYIMSRWSVMCKNGNSPLLPFWVNSFEWILKVNPCTYYNFHTPWDIFVMFGRSIFQLKIDCLVQEWNLSLASCINYLSSMMNLKGKTPSTLDNFQIFLMNTFKGKTLWFTLLLHPFR